MINNKNNSNSNGNNNNNNNGNFKNSKKGLADNSFTASPDTNSPSSSNFDYEAFKRESIQKLYDGKGLSGRDGVFTNMIKDFLETALKEELNNHLQSNKHNRNHNKNQNESEDFDCDSDIEDDGNDNGNSNQYQESLSNNRRNGYTSKNIKTNNGSFSLDTPRDRSGTFNPSIVKKNQTILKTWHMPF